MQNEPPQVIQPITVSTAPPELPKKKSHPTLVIGSIIVVLGIVLGGLTGWYISSSKKPLPKTANVQQPSNASANESSFKIGMIVPLTGDGASYGINAKEIALMIEKDVNTKGGMGGRNVIFYFEDGQCLEENARSAAEKLINKDKVDFLYAGECSDEMLASAPIAQANKIISYSTGATNPKISTLGKYVFRSALSDAAGGKVAAQYAAKKMQAKTATILVENTSYANGLKDVFKEEFAKLGGTTLHELKYETGETEFTTIVETIKKDNPDLVYIVPQTPLPGVLAIKAIKATKIPTKFLTAEVLLARDEIEKHGKILEGLVGMEAYFDAENPAYKKLQEMFTKEYGRDVAYPTDLMDIRDMVYIYKDAYEKVGSNDTDKISEVLYSNKNWPGAGGNITFNESGDIISKPYGIYKVSENKAVFIEKYTAE